MNANAEQVSNAALEREFLALLAADKNRAQRWARANGWRANKQVAIEHYAWCDRSNHAGDWLDAGYSALEAQRGYYQFMQHQIQRLLAS